MRFYVMFIILKSPPPTLALEWAKKSKTINVVSIVNLKNC